ncbi:Mitogen-activated protein kinase kinase kinase [Parasponia andersonii]|uniref:non-specific serine/threonine protein kinase n=1 Tax=Parasponia andersonii TaxID=3476 RepID=A0A2P5E4Q0_PARAD|nr:Mitogen-activated protein kinase kinase kinase [Parasponia andersonii]
MESEKLDLALVGAIVPIAILILCNAPAVYYRRRKRGDRENIEGNHGLVPLFDTERRIAEFLESGQFNEDERKGLDVPFVALESIRAATDNFSEANRLGRGGFGPVYKNLVGLLGYCVEGEEKMLLYEYMPNVKAWTQFEVARTVSKNYALGLDIHFNIILRIARGLVHFHYDSRLRIIHRDLKIGNVLLDGVMNPKISNFVLARIFGGRQTKRNTTRVAWKLWKENKPLDLMDISLCETCNANEFLRCINVGLLCVQDDPNNRPTMSNVGFMLGGETVMLPSPKQPVFVARSHSSSGSSSKPLSINELTDTLEQGR